jgi:hydrogenase expression/formation protein HypD
LIGVEPGVLESFRDPALARALAGAIGKIPVRRPITLMHVCGTHEHTIGRSGLRSLLPRGVRLIAGPGCPVCVCPASDVDLAIEASRRAHTIVATFGDMFRVPSTESSFERTKAEGFDIRTVYSPLDAVALAKAHPDREIVFMAVGFETTAAPIAATLAAHPPENFSIISSLRVIPPALRFLLERKAGSIDGFILPGHVSAIIGRRAYDFLASEFGVSGAIAGFEPIDVLQAVHDLIAKVAEGGRPEVVNLYRRVVHEEGNPAAREMMARLFEAADVPWRGIGAIPGSGLVLGPTSAGRDAVGRLGLVRRRDAVDVPPGCLCHLVILGEVEPEACPLFGVGCTPRGPVGPCMVSSEGTCRARYQYRPVRS